jgi:hypothetical protein
LRKSSRTERSPSRSEEVNQSKEIEKKTETVFREIREDMGGIVEENKVRRKEIAAVAAVREKKGEQEREDMPKSSEVRKESSKREREERRTSKEDKTPLRNSSRRRRSPNRSEEENQSKEMKTTMIREIREEIKTLRKELVAVREEMRGREEKGLAEKADWMKRMKMMEQREKKERKNNVIITGIGAISGNIERRVEKWLEMVNVNVKEAFKINKDKMMLPKIESWEEKKNIMLNKSKLKEKKDERKKGKHKRS